MRGQVLTIRITFGACVLLGILGPFLRGVDAATVIAHAEQQLVIVRTQAKPGERVVQRITIKLIRVIPRTGNNPVNPIEPINNRDGRIVPAAEEATFTPLSVSYGKPDPAVDIGVVSLVWGSGDQWTLRSGDARSRDAIVIQLTEGNPGAVSVHTSVRSSNFTIAGANPMLDFPDDGLTHMFDARHVPTGRLFRVTFRADRKLTGGVLVSAIVLVQ